MLSVFQIHVVTFYMFHYISQFMQYLFNTLKFTDSKMYLNSPNSFSLFLGSHSNVAFYSYMNHDLPTPSPAHTLVFDVSPTDSGNHYNKFTGIFTAPHSGTYVFTWTSYCVAGGNTYLQAVVNDAVLDSSYCNAIGALWHRSITGTVVAYINQGDAVFIRTHPGGTNNGEVISSDNHRTTFAGWLLF